ncbi:MAG: hypothetical protein CFE39_02805 [Comamonadaceae bacterium PBBC2]|nr:MAG: hypothetical protein CFE39_02805 [Comamonadaceae bacterium PBBC2]
MKSTTHLIRLACLVSATAGLVACGGGGSAATESTNSGSNNNSAQVAVLPDGSVVNSIPSDILVQIPASTYAAGSQEQLVFKFLNAERIRCGFGALRHAPQLDASAMAHANWGVLNQQLSHLELASTYPNGFTGATLTDRARFHGYDSQSLGEVFSGFTNMPASASEGITSMRLLLNAPYHMVFMTAPYRDMGVGVKRIADVGKSSGFDLVMTEFGVLQQDSFQDLATDAVATYPCEGTTGVAYSLNNEDPNPIPGRDLSTKPLGSSIIFRVRRGQKLNIDAISVVETATGTAVGLRRHVGGNGNEDSTYKDFDASVAYVAAESPMKPNTSYTVKVNGSNDGASFSKQFTFQTGDIYLPSF